MKKYILPLVLFVLTGCKQVDKTATVEVLNLPWSEVEKEAQNKSLTMMMWSGDPKINAYIKDYVTPKIDSLYGIKLNVVSGQGAQIVQLLMTEKQAQKYPSDVDLVWINGETFYQLRQIDALFGPWTDKLPNARYINFENPFIGTDFQQKIEGYELPWGNVQMTLIYDRQKIVQPPKNREELKAFVQAHPGVFTFDNHFTGLTFLKALLIDIAGGSTALDGDFDEEKYQKCSTELWAYLNELKPYLWQKGEVFPENVAQMHQLFAAGELWFTMSNNDAEVDNKIAEGLFPESARAYVPDFGTIQNSHYLGITQNSGNKAAALVLANFMVSPQAQYHKMQPPVWGDGTVLNIKTLPEAWQEKFGHIPSRQYAPNREEISNRALKELAPEYMIRLAEDFSRAFL